MVDTALGARDVNRSSVPDMSHHAAIAGIGHQTGEKFRIIVKETV
jgi:hypothetical protein